MISYLEGFKDPDTAKSLVKKLSLYKGRLLTIMEVCGTHTVCIFRYGIKSLLPQNIRLVSGPGCPVCVTHISFVDEAIALSALGNTIIATFGDMLKVPGSSSTLQKEKASGKDIRIVYSPLDAVKIAEQNPDKNVVFLSVGFETTTPVAALSVLKAAEKRVKNFHLLTANKTVPKALEVLASDKEITVDGYLYPGHVSAIIGTKAYLDLAEKFGVGGVVAGFEPVDILYAISSLVDDISQNQVSVKNLYTRVVKDEGNQIALEKMYEVFEPCDSVWRGLGIMEGSGLSLRPAFKEFDARAKFKIDNISSVEPSGCLCGEVLKGKKKPTDCPLFGKKCTPENAVGACMVSSEGTCAAYYKYGGFNANDSHN